MRLNRIVEDDNRPEYEWMETEVPSHGDPCPVPGCRGVVKNRWRGMGAPRFRACKYGHAWKIAGGESQRASGEMSPVELMKWYHQLKKIADLGGEIGDEGEKHTCRFPPSTDQLSKMDEDDRSRVSRNRRSCKKCSSMYDALLDIEMDELVDPEKEREEAEAKARSARAREEIPVSRLSQRLSELSPSLFGIKPEKRPSAADFERLIQKQSRAGHEAGRFGTGRVSPIDVERDSPIMAALKLSRDATMSGKRAKYRDRCGHGHTCWDHPLGKPAQNFPLPDPMAGEKTGKYRYNNMFTEVSPPVVPGMPQEKVPGTDQPWTTFKWPVSGLSGFKPREPYMTYVMSKVTCPACTDPEKYGCPNPVWQEEGQAKPFCKEHISEMPYAKELHQRWGEGLSLSGADSEAEEKYKEWRRIHAESILPGDKVRWKFIPNSLRGQKAKTGSGYHQVYVIATGETQEYDPDRGWLVQYEWDSDQVPVYVNEGKGRNKRRLQVGTWDSSSLTGLTYLDADYLDVFEDNDPQDWEPGDPDAPRKSVRG